MRNRHHGIPRFRLRFWRRWRRRGNRLRNRMILGDGPFIEMPNNVSTGTGTGTPTHTIPLAAVRVGQEVRICSLATVNGEAQRLRELGLLEGKTIRIVAKNHHLICQVGECRFGLCRRLASGVIVRPLETQAADLTSAELPPLES